MTDEQINIARASGEEQFVAFKATDYMKAATFDLSQPTTVNFLGRSHEPKTLTELCALPSDAFEKYLEAQKEAGGPEAYAMQSRLDEDDQNALMSKEEVRVGNKMKLLLAEIKLWRSELSKVMPPDFKDWWQNSPREWPIVARWCIENLRNRLNLAHNEEDALINRISQLEKDLENRPTQEEYERVCTSNHALERELAELRHTIRLDAIDKIPKMSP